MSIILQLLGEKGLWITGYNEIPNGARFCRGIAGLFCTPVPVSTLKTLQVLSLVIDLPALSRLKRDLDSIVAT
ncbi:uncharacterized protein N7529_001881 [Penicillium soppii]|uniref:uncharacterized protein n=1 Tax=Penicillium soppii TaxID=69789 RepID=UPI0025492859|nr:uncharacterized protein N7529_001881 [Penicillium soppii]KAJ5876297.1 hypothetical protein N7529_001881 [Penicillium soppii]